MKQLKTLGMAILFFVAPVIYSQNNSNSEIKNIILLIPDGASVDLLSLTRWFNGNQPLALDPLICGMVKTYNANNKFPDSAPTSTAYATGVKTITPFIGVDSLGKPQISVLEAARLKGLSTGIVVTCEFPHATPADFVCHFNSRERTMYSNLTRQFVYNSPSLVFAGGKYYLEANQLINTLKKNGFRIIDNLNDFNKNNRDSVWALFSDWNGSTKFKSFECDRDKSTEPGLSEMTRKAIEILSQNQKGFFLMVEGSQVDWACHNNDPFAAVTEFAEFDKAVKKSVEFAEKDGQTIVIICPDHGNGGISLGNAQSNTSFYYSNPTKYDKINIQNDIIVPLKLNQDKRISGRKMAELMLKDSGYKSQDSINKYYYLNDPTILNEIKKISAEYPVEEYPDTVQYLLGRSFSAKHFIGWTTTGHTAEDVFLGIYAPRGVDKLTGIVDNSEVGKYIATQLKLGNLSDTTNKYFCPYNQIFSQEEIKSISKDSLFISFNKQKLIIYPNTNYFKVLQKKKAANIKLPTLAIFEMNQNSELEYYLPKNILELPGTNK